VKPGAGRPRQGPGKKGVVGRVRSGLRALSDRVTSSYPWHRLFYSRRTFVFQGERHAYLLHRYNSTWKTERVVEVPIVWEEVRRASGLRVLEVGNVLAHYFPVTHDRVDKYERAPGVVNVDIVDYAAPPYDLIVSISTLEHVGWDEPERDPDKVLRAVANLRALTAPGGRLVITLPIAYNPHVDAHLREGRIPFSQCHYLRRVSRDNRWAEASWDEVKDAQYDTPFRRINALVVGTIDAEPPGTERPGQSLR
jgi:SAM-dependent methyltransferase